MRHWMRSAVLAWMLVMAACAGASDDDACAPFDDAARDPCAGDLNELEGRVQGTLIMPEVWGVTEPWPVREYLESGLGGGISDGHLVVRGQYTPGTVRCAYHRGVRFITGPSTDYLDQRMLHCYAEIAVASYIVGEGPSTLTAVIARDLITSLAAFEAIVGNEENGRRAAELSLNEGIPTWHFRHVPAGGVTGIEAILFLGPAVDTSIETWEVHDVWDLERQDGGTVIAVHPDRIYWERKSDYETAYRHMVEMPIATFVQNARAAHAARIADNDGRVGADEDLPMVVTNAANLHSFYVETGAIDHPKGAPVQPPPACGKAVPDQASNPGLMLDCETLLAAKDMLRGTGTLNWSVDVAMADWDGVKIRDGRVSEVLLLEKGLTGAVPAELANLTGLQHLWLNRNQLTGTIPPELGSLPAIKSLLLNENQLTGPIPTELGGLASLEALWLTGNQLTGTIPTELASLSKLEDLLLSGNRLTGSIPSGIGSLSSLEILWLSHNQLTGNVPSALGNLSKLKKLTLSNNQLTGAIPTSLGDLADTLTELRMANNQLTGCIPAGLRGVAINDLDRLGLSDCTE